MRPNKFESPAREDIEEGFEEFEDGEEEMDAIDVFEALQAGDLGEAFDRKLYMPEDYDMTRIDDFREVYRQRYLELLEDDNLSDLESLRYHFGEKIDEGEIVREAFEKALKEGKITRACNMASKFSTYLDPTNLTPGDRLTIRSRFGECLAEMKVAEVLEIWKTFPQLRDFLGSVKGYEEGVIACFLRSLQSGKLDLALRVKILMGKGIDFAQADGYAEAAKNGMIQCFWADRLSDALKIKEIIVDSFDPQDYSRVMAAICDAIYGNFVHYLKGEDVNEDYLEGLRNEFYIRSRSRITPELLMKFESLIHFANHYIRELLTWQLYGMGYRDPESQDYKKRLTEEEKKALRRTMQLEMQNARDKIQSIASPELIQAYQEAQEEDEWLKTA